MAADRLQSGKVTVCLAGIIWQEVDNPSGQFTSLTTARQTAENPRSLAKPLDQTRIVQEFEMARDPRLTLAQDLGEFADGQFGTGQKPQNPEPCGFACRAQTSEQDIKGDGHA
jgi:hypothetical protein